MTARTEPPSRTPEGSGAFPRPLDRSGYAATAGAVGTRAGCPAGPGLPRSPRPPRPPRPAAHPLPPDDAGTAPAAAAAAPTPAPPLRDAAGPVPGRPA
ncbi:hypothetical protein K353_01119 [Kitasatospora sp. SolWspMP-SS2h]|uniref:hypothetical protein n=1 Tax=Kitasatospora sp. SolWspMP-SS2h TaxID=1305729 RepID=UPI000DBAC106|nr:hypothetical protein [Kitasatospora sp. SolWspMP-SS2h]RAJ45619.1 hypothetical protein K353_01119 [Kitasatospora sp. SolWspMP-SS2h]